MAIAKKVSRPALTADYDQDADVLYISVGKPRPSEGEDLECGIVLRYPFDDPTHVWAVTVVGYKANGWARKVEVLAKRLAPLLSVSRDETANIIRRTTGQR